MRWKMFWLFDDPPNLAVITTRDIIKEGNWISYVTHDEDDGSWQFLHEGALPDLDDACVVALRTIVKLDNTVVQLHDLPLGWCAWRSSTDARWQRSKK
jgi:hypothetical protein